MNHPITPPPELVQQWRKSAPTARDAGATREVWIATQAARWGADTELKACCEWCADGSMVLAQELRAARRPKPPSLAEEALELVNKIQANEKMWQLDELDVVRAALERLKELEQSND